MPITVALPVRGKIDFINAAAPSSPFSTAVIARAIARGSPAKSFVIESERAFIGISDAVIFALFGQKAKKRAVRLASLSLVLCPWSLVFCSLFVISRFLLFTFYFL